MVDAVDTTKARVIEPSYDNRGNPRWRMRMSPPDDTFALLPMVPDRIVPVIFVPGVMGSNLIEKDKNNPRDRKDAVKWRLDSAGTAVVWASPTHNAAYRKRYLNPTVMEVDAGGIVPAQRVVNTGTPEWPMEDIVTPSPVAQSPEELQRRGWGEVGNLSYGEWLVWLENALNDFSDPAQGERVKLMRDSLQALVGESLLTDNEVGLSYRYRFPVHSCGYNWLDDNKNSAVRLTGRIKDILDRYTKEKKRVDKVILVTHSMGGLVARYCSEVLGQSDRIYGIVHGVMPAFGAPAVYRRMKSGTEDTTSWWNVKGAVAAAALGNDAAEMTAVLSSAPGPLQLLPTAEYGSGWLQIVDGGKTLALPSPGKDGSPVDPYEEVYTVKDRWWSLCEKDLINPLNEERDPKKREALMEAAWLVYVKIIRKQVKAFHEDLFEKYHANTHAFFGSDDHHKAYGTIKWTGTGGSWLRGQRDADVLSARDVRTGELGESRTVAAPLGGKGWLKAEHQVYTINEPDVPGDGTVPHRSGVAPEKRCKSFMKVRVEHEGAFRASGGDEYVRACRFTLRAIVKIAQTVAASRSMKYE